MCLALVHVRPSLCAIGSHAWQVCDPSRLWGAPLPWSMASTLERCLRRSAGVALSRVPKWRHASVSAMEHDGRPRSPCGHTKELDSIIAQYARYAAGVVCWDLPSSASLWSRIQWRTMYPYVCGCLEVNSDSCQTYRTVVGPCANLWVLALAFPGWSCQLLVTVKRADKKGSGLSTCPCTIKHWSHDV